MAPVVERICDSVELGEGPHWDVETQSLYFLGEGPHWDVETQSLYFVDIFGKAIHKYVPSTKRQTKAVIGNHVSLIIPVEGQKDKFVISIGRELAVITWDGENEKVSDIKKLCEVDNVSGKLDNRFNDGKCDPAGRIWAGTMGGEPENGHVKAGQGSFFSMGPNKEVKTHLTTIGISNGLAWNTELNKFYYIDSFKGTVDEYDFDLESGTISNCKPIFTMAKHVSPGIADGMAIDTDGNLWIAVFNGHKVIKIDPRQPETLLESIEIPAKQTTSVAFGGPNLDELYVTSASFTVDGEELPPPDNGATFRVTGINAKGFEGVRVKL